MLKDELATIKNVKPVSETDSEVIALWIGVFLDEGKTIVEAIKEACLKIVGTYNIALIYIEDPKAVYAIKNAGEFVVALDALKGHGFVCSDKDVLTDEFNLKDLRFLKENELVRISATEVQTFDFSKTDATMQKVKLKEGVSHFFI